MIELHGPACHDSPCSSMTGATDRCAEVMGSSSVGDLKELRHDNLSSFFFAV